MSRRFPPRSAASAMSNLSFLQSAVPDWSDETTVVDLTPELLDIVERARAKYLARVDASQDKGELRESGVLRVAPKVSD
jgi:hypothetical protein